MGCSSRRSTLVSLVIHILWMDSSGCTWLKKRIERTASRLFLGSEYQGLQFINSVKNEFKNVYIFLPIFISFSPYKKRIVRSKIG